MKKRNVAVAFLLFTVVLFSSKNASAGDESQPQDLKSVVACLRDSLKDVQQQLDQLKLQFGFRSIYGGYRTSCGRVVVRGGGIELGSGFVRTG